MKREIKSIFEVELPGVQAVRVDRSEYLFETNFWVCPFPADLSEMSKADWVRIHRREPVFDRMEVHEAPECAFFCSGEAIMPFGQMKDGKLDPESLCLLRIPEGTQVMIGANVPHYIAVAATDEIVNAVYVHHPVDAPRIFLEEALEAAD